MDTTIERAAEGGYRYAAVERKDKTVALQVRWLDTGAWFTVAEMTLEQYQHLNKRLIDIVSEALNSK